MLPRNSTNDRTDVGLTGMKSGSKVCLFYSSCSHFFNQAHLAFCQFRRSNIFSSWSNALSFLISVIRIIFSCSKKKMIWINTPRNIAGMADEHPCGYLSMYKSPTNPMGMFDSKIRNANCAVSSADGTKPQPTAVLSFFNLHPKTGSELRFSPFTGAESGAKGTGIETGRTSYRTKCKEFLRAITARSWHCFSEINIGHSYSILWFTVLFLLFLSLCSVANAQTGNTTTVVFPGVPSGTCGLFTYFINGSNGDFYDCPSRTPVQGGSSSSGRRTMTSFA